MGRVPHVSLSVIAAVRSVPSLSTVASTFVDHKLGLTPRPAHEPTMLRFIEAFRKLAIRTPGSPLTQGLLEAANVLERCLPHDPIPSGGRVRVDVDELLGRPVKSGATLRSTARP